MAITELRILPPLAISRLGSSPTPLDNYNLVHSDEPLGFRKIEPAETLYVDETSGEISDHSTPEVLRFRDGHRIRPVAPFLEVFCRRNDQEFVPLTVDILRENGLKPGDIRWTVHVANLKLFRRTGDSADEIRAVEGFSDHMRHELLATCANFLPGKVLPLGSVRYIKPNHSYNEIRIRFTPAHGIVYGASTKRKSLDSNSNLVEMDDPVISADRVLYDSTKPWYGYTDGDGAPAQTNPNSIYAGYADTKGHQISWGYLDDECDGMISLELKVGAEVLRASARIGAGPPTFAPDGVPIRTVADDLDQVLLGPNVDPKDAKYEDAEEIVRRAYETVRLMNTAVMNGNTINGRRNVASTMVRQDTNDAGRLFEPIMATSLVDNLSLRALHQSVLAALRGGSSPWFLNSLRMPEEVGDLTDKGRRKMPALMRGGDGRYLTLTRRQIDTIRKVASVRDTPPKVKK